MEKRCQRGYYRWWLSQYYCLLLLDFCALRPLRCCWYSVRSVGSHDDDDEFQTEHTQTMKLNVVCWGWFRVLHSKICLGYWRRPRNFHENIARNQLDFSQTKCCTHTHTHWWWRSTRTTTMAQYMHRTEGGKFTRDRARQNKRTERVHKCVKIKHAKN